MAQRTDRLKPIDTYQRELHFTKEAKLIGVREDRLWDFITEKFVLDLYNEVNILRDRINHMTSQQIDVVIPVLHAFANQGETILVNGIGSVLEKPESYDVVLLPDVSTLQEEYPGLIQAALKVAKKRVIVGYYANSYKKEFEKYLDTLQMHWMKNEEPKEHYVIDKEPQILDTIIKEITDNGTSEIQRQRKQAEERREP